MGDAPKAARKPCGSPTARKPCCVCDAPGGQHCTKCKSRHYCSKACQLVDWKEGGHKEQCKQLAAKFQDRLLDELMPAKKVKEEPAIVEDVAPVAGSKAAAGLAAVQAPTTAVVKSTKLTDDAPSWRGSCAICLDVLAGSITFYDCCCKKICKECSDKCLQNNRRCPLCRTAARTSDAEWVRRMQKHVDKGNSEAQIMLGTQYFHGGMGLKKSPKKACQLYKLSAAQGHADAQTLLGARYELGQGVTIDYNTAAYWYGLAVDQGYSVAQFNLAGLFHNGTGVAQSLEEAVRLYKLAAAQDHHKAIFNMGTFHVHGTGVARDHYEALRYFKRSAALGDAGSVKAAKDLGALLGAFGRPACDDPYRPARDDRPA